MLQVTTPHAIAQKGEYKVEDDTLISLPLAQGRHAKHGNEGQLFGKVLLPQPFTTHVGTFSGKYFPNETYGPYYELSSPDKVTETAFLVVLYPQLRGAPAPEVKKADAKNGIAFEVAVPNGRNFHLYNTGEGTAAGARQELDGLISMVSVDSAGKLTRYAMCEGRRLTFEDKTPRIRMEIQALDLGPETLVCVPAEVFSGIGLNIKRSLDGQKAMVVGYANGCVGYIPTRAAFRTQGYATRLATHLSNGTALAPSVGEVVAKQAVTFARSLRRVP